MGRGGEAPAHRRAPIETTWNGGEFRHDVAWTCFFAGTMKVKSSNIQVGDLIIVEKVSGVSAAVSVCVCVCECDAVAAPYGS